VLPMPMVHLAPLLSTLAGVAGLLAVDRLSPLSAAGWTTGLAYLVASGALLARGLRRARTSSFGWATAATATRSTLVGLVTALVATSFTAPVAVSLLAGIAAVALALDAVDGWLARRTHGESELGARFDMEVDAFLLLALSAYVAQSLGWWVLVIGMLRYAFVAAGWALPWMRRTLPPRYWRKVVTAVTGVALVAAASGLLPFAGDLAVTLLALALLLESFGRDVLWLAAHRRLPATRDEADQRRNVRSTT
jgi:phosphatidylglycerophosphate synthase